MHNRERLIEVPNGWSPLSTKSPSYWQVRKESDGHVVFDQNRKEHTIPKPSLSEIEAISYNPEELNGHPRITIPFFYQGVGDWIRSAASIKNIKAASLQNIQILGLKDPLSCDFVDTQLARHINGAFWIPKSPPYYNQEPSESLDWNPSSSHIAWELLLEDIMSRDNNKDASVILRNPNRKLPPYGRFVFDYRLGLFACENQTISYNLTSESQSTADSWWRNKTKRNNSTRRTIGIAFRNDPNLMSAHRNTETANINFLIKLIKDKQPNTDLVLYGNTPPDDLDLAGLDAYDFCNSWKVGVSINEQAAVLARLDGVIGINSGGLDLPLACGVPGLRLRAPLPPYNFLNDYLNSSTVNVAKERATNADALAEAADRFLGILEDRQDDTKGNNTNIYITPDGIIRRERIPIPPIELNSIFKGKGPRTVILTEEDGIRPVIECYRQGIYPIIMTEKDNPTLTAHFNEGYGLKYLDRIPTGVITPPSSVDEVERHLLEDTDDLNMRIYAGYLKYITMKEQEQITELS